MWNKFLLPFRWKYRIIKRGTIYYVQIRFLWFLWIDLESPGYHVPYRFNSSEDAVKFIRDMTQKRKVSIESYFDKKGNKR